MNKLNLLAGLLLSCSFTAAAQDAPAPSVKSHFTGVRFGPSLTTITGNDATNTQVGAHAGIYYLTMESDKVGIQLEAQYSLQGAELERGHLLLHYLNIPVVSKLFLSPNASILGGGYCGLLLAQRYQYGGYTNMEGADYGLTYGLSFGNESKATISLRHQVGLARIFNKYSRSKNQTLQLSLNYCLFNK
ncbi:hypothetical protein [Pontibacter liquoris]|uniref:hypothetical protein n=1 Tax=Pontibacter liquoris TaxID=2905677 RepID=UPI001FA741F9|nr:hypothetical protein [Pontibacter liquoris]